MPHCGKCDSAQLEARNGVKEGIAHGELGAMCGFALVMPWKGDAVRLDGGMVGAKGIRNAARRPRAQVAMPCIVKLAHALHYILT